MMSLINKLADPPPNYYKTARMFPKSSALPYSMNKLTLIEPVIKSSKILLFLNQGRQILRNTSAMALPHDVLMAFFGYSSKLELL